MSSESTSKFKEYVESCLPEMTVLVDSRERNNEHILRYFEKEKIPYEVKKLLFGDYSARLRDLPLEWTFAVERKGSLQELANNLSGDGWDRFGREIGATERPFSHVQMAVLLEDASMRDLFVRSWPYGGVTAETMRRFFFGVSVRYDVSLHFAEKAESGETVYYLLRETFRQKIRHGGINL